MVGTRVGVATTNSKLHMWFSFLLESAGFNFILRTMGCYSFKQGSNIIRFVFLEYYSGYIIGNGFGKNLDVETSEKTAKKILFWIRSCGSKIK